MNKKWSPAEKKVARQIYDLALANAQKEIVKRHFEKKISTMPDLWDYELEIREWRKHIRSIFQYTYSSLDYCFAICYREGWLKKSNLTGLSEDKIEYILRDWN